MTSRPADIAVEAIPASSRMAPIASRRSFFEPRSVAVVGANRERGKIGSEILHNLISSGFTGRLVAVHPTASEIDGVRAFPSIGDVPHPVDLAVIVVPAHHVLHAVDECLAAGVRALCVISAGFSESDLPGREREAALVDRVRRAGCRLIGPNCMGLLNTDPSVRLNATFSPVHPPAGNVAMSTQSGALGLAILDYAKRLHIGISSFVSVGNKPDVSGNDLIQYWADDPRTSVILLYLESFGRVRHWRAALATWIVAGLATVFSGMVAARETSAAPPPQVHVREDAGAYRVTARFEVPQPAAVALTVLTDYEQIPRFMPDVKTSTIAERSGDHIVVEQEAIARVMLFSKRVYLRLDVRTTHDTITFRDVSGRSFTAYEGMWRVTEQGGCTTVRYELRAQPSFDVPAFLLTRLLKRNANEMIERLRTEMAARARVAGLQ